MKASIINLAPALVLFLASFGEPKELTLTSPAFLNNSVIPSRYSCEGERINPPLNVGNIPAGARSLAIVVFDPDAELKGGVTHWIVWNVPADGNIPENYKGAEQGLNSEQQNSYIGMCPPNGTHHYHFMVYALDTKLSLDKNTDKARLESAMRGHIVARGEMIGLYKKTEQGRKD